MFCSRGPDQGVSKIRDGGTSATRSWRRDGARIVVPAIHLWWHGGAVLIYKILLPAEWDHFEAAGRFDGSPFDKESGFIHCSSRDQVVGVAERVFGGEPELVVVAVDADALGDTVRWDPVPDGGSYPHIYGSLPSSAVVAVHRVAGVPELDRQLPRD